MRTNKEVQEWLNNNPIDINEVDAVELWLNSNRQHELMFTLEFTNGGKTLPDVIDFVNSPSPSKEKDLSPIVAQLAKVKKEVDKLQKLIEKL